MSFVLLYKKKKKKFFFNSKLINFSYFFTFSGYLPHPNVRLTTSRRGTRVLSINGYQFYVASINKNSINWRCTKFRKFNCLVKAYTTVSPTGILQYKLNNALHTHAPPNLFFR